jgi:hypothetical protein
VLVPSDGYHGLEALEAMVERRAGGESGICAVQAMSGDAIWAAAAQGRWQLELAQAALGLIDTRDEAQADAAATAASGKDAVAAVQRAAGKEATLFLLEYSDGFSAALLHGQGDGTIFSGWSYAARVDGQIVGTAFCGNEAPNYPPFSWLGLNIEQVRCLPACVRSKLARSRGVWRQIIPLFRG